MGQERSFDVYMKMVGIDTNTKKGITCKTEITFPNLTILLMSS